MPPAYLQGPIAPIQGATRPCQGKIRFDSALLAYEVLWRKDRAGSPYRARSVYRCKCGSWHLTSEKNYDAVINRQQRHRAGLVRLEIVAR